MDGHESDDCRALVRDHDVIYIYHNRIDATGDKRESKSEFLKLWKKHHRI